MIDITQLRPGNMVLAKSADSDMLFIPKIITAADIAAMEEVGSDDIFPMPISDNVMENKCGFRITSSERTAVAAQIPTGNSELYISKMFANGRQDWVLVYKDAKITLPAFHDLQNAWFVLFRIELTLK